jgi:lysophospholipase L1-like esterase
MNSRTITNETVKMRIFLTFTLAVSITFLSCKKDTVVPTHSAVDTTMVFFNAENTFIQYSGRIDFTDPKSPTFWFPGISIKADFQGPAIDMVIQDHATGTAQTTNYYNVFIDNTLYKVLQVNSSDTLYKIARNLSDANHKIEIFKRTEAQVGGSTFRGFRLQINKALIAPANQFTRKIEFIGDSYTCGYGDEASIAAPPTGDPNTGFHSVNENNYNAWGAIVARDLNTEYHCTAYSGRGLYRNNNSATTGILPSIYSRTNPDNASSTWATSNYVPDVVVIHLGTNDFSPEQTATPSMVDSITFVNTYIRFITTLRGYYPDAKIICVRPNSETDYYPVNFKTLTRMTSYIKAVTNHFTGTDANVFYFELTAQLAPYGEDWHPSAATQQSMATQIEPFIKTKTGW